MSDSGFASSCVRWPRDRRQYRSCASERRRSLNLGKVQNIDVSNRAAPEQCDQSKAAARWCRRGAPDATAVFVKLHCPSMRFSMATVTRWRVPGCLPGLPCAKRPLDVSPLWQRLRLRQDGVGGSSGANSVGAGGGGPSGAGARSSTAAEGSDTVAAAAWAYHQAVDRRRRRNWCDHNSEQRRLVDDLESFLHFGGRSRLRARQSRAQHFLSPSRLLRGFSAGGSAIVNPSFIWAARSTGPSASNSTSGQGLHVGSPG